MVVFLRNNKIYNVPAFSKNSVDSIGAGDVFFSWSSLFYFINKNLSLSAFCGSIAASYKVLKLGNKVTLIVSVF